MDLALRRSSFSRVLENTPRDRHAAKPIQKIAVPNWMVRKCLATSVPTLPISECVEQTDVVSRFAGRFAVPGQRGVQRGSLGQRVLIPKANLRNHR